MGLHVIPTPPRRALKRAFERVLLATDLSEASEHAQRYAISLVECIRGSLFVVHVEGGSDSLQNYATENPALIERFAALHAGKRHELETVLRDSRVPFSLLFRSGDITEALNQVVEQNDIHVVVMGTHARQGSAHTFLGSVAENVIRSSRCPVLTVGPHAAPAPETPLQNILYVTDFSPASEAAAAYAIFLAQQFNATLTALHVAPSVELPESEGSRIEEFRLNRLKGLVSVEEWPDLQHVVAHGDPLQEIITTAQKEAADLMVLGVHRSVEFTSHFPARLSYQLLCQAPCPVLSILPEERARLSAAGKS